MERVMIVGPCGAGKSTLAHDLAQRLDLPLFHMDQLNWRSGWIESEAGELRAAVEAVAAGPRWLIDGTYGGTMAPRVERADAIVYLDFPILLCAWRVLRRVAIWRGRPRPDMPKGCPERFDAAFMLYVLRWNNGPRPRLEARLDGHEHKVIRLKNPRALRRWLGTLPDTKGAGPRLAPNA